MATGWIGDLPQLKDERWSHACGYFYNNEKDLVYLVTGGANDEQILKSTEVLISSSWEKVDEIKSGGPGIRGINLDNHIFIIGGSTQEELALNEVYEFDLECRCWKLRGTVKVSRYFHSISTLPLRSIKPYCFPSSSLKDGSFDLCGKIESNWRRVRHVPQGDTFHSATDDLKGTDVYGNPEDDSQPWSIKFKLTDFDEFLFISGNGNLWLRLTKVALIGEDGYKFYYGEPIQIISSNLNCSPYSVNMYRTVQSGIMVVASADIWLLYYSEGDSYNPTQLTDGGFDVYIRKNN